MPAARALPGQSLLSGRAFPFRSRFVTSLSGASATAGGQTGAYTRNVCGTFGIGMVDMAGAFVAPPSPLAHGGTEFTVTRLNG